MRSEVTTFPAKPRCSVGRAAVERAEQTTTSAIPVATDHGGLVQQTVAAPRRAARGLKKSRSPIPTARQPLRASVVSSVKVSCSHVARLQPGSHRGRAHRFGGELQLRTAGVLRNSVPPIPTHGESGLLIVLRSVRLRRAVPVARGPLGTRATRTWAGTWLPQCSSPRPRESTKPVASSGFHHAAHLHRIAGKVRCAEVMATF